MASKRLPVAGAFAIVKFLALFLALFSIVHVACAEDQQILDAGLDGTLNHIQYEAAGQPDPPRFIEAKQKLLDKIRKEDEDVEVSNIHPRYWLLRALYGYWRHGQRYQQETAKKSTQYFAMSEEHRNVSSDTEDLKRGIRS